MPRGLFSASGAAVKTETGEGSQHAGPFFQGRLAHRAALSSEREAARSDLGRGTRTRVGRPRLTPLTWRVARPAGEAFVFLETVRLP